jgi:uncharacterized protein
MTGSSILWRRLDSPGHDSCSFQGGDGGWRLDGTAVFRHDRLPAILSYHVECDAGWRTQGGWVRGQLGVRRVELVISASGGIWHLNERVIAGLDGSMDLDLGFTPATNLLPIRRLALVDGQAGDAPAAWLNVSDGTLTKLPQRYERRSASAYWYEAPTLGYAAQLDVTSTGLVRKYPGLWEEEEP